MPAAATASVCVQVDRRRRREDDGIDVVAREQRVQGLARAGHRSRPPTRPRAARRSPPTSDVPAAWCAATSAHVRPMNPEPTTPTRTVMRRRRLSIEEVDPGRPAVLDELVAALRRCCGAPGCRR